MSLCGLAPQTRWPDWRLEQAPSRFRLRTTNINESALDYRRRGAYLSILSAGDAPDPRFTLRHLQAHRFGSLPAVTVSDMRLISADGQLLHPGIMSLTAGWNAQAPIPAFGHLLRDWPLAPLPAMVLRRTPFLRAFFEPSVAPLDPRLTGWLLGQFLVLLSGATVLPRICWTCAFRVTPPQIPRGCLASSIEAGPSRQTCTRQRHHCWLHMRGPTARSAGTSVPPGNNALYVGCSSPQALG